MVAASLASQLFHMLDNFRAVTLIPVAFVDSEVNDTEVL